MNNRVKTTVVSITKNETRMGDGVGVGGGARGVNRGVRVHKQKGFERSGTDG